MSILGSLIPTSDIYDAAQDGWDFDEKRRDARKKSALADMLTQAKIGQLGAQTQGLLHPQAKASDFVIQKGPNNELYRVSKLDPSKSEPVMGPDGKQLIGPATGVTVGYDDQGRPIVTTGGASANTTARAGGVQTDPNTGKQTFMPTTASKTKLFNQAAAAEKAIPIINDLKELANHWGYFSGGGFDKAWDDTIGGVFDGAGTQRRQAIDNDINTYVNSAMDSISKAYGVNLTDKQLGRVRDLLMPKSFKTKTRYFGGLHDLPYLMMQFRNENLNQGKGMKLASTDKDREPTQEGIYGGALYQRKRKEAALKKLEEEG